jgi:predicted double-glycine peptidase
MIKEQEVKFKATKIIDYPGFRQSTEYSCGACVTQSALVYCFGSKYDLPEINLMKKLKTTESDGTDPKSIIKFLTSKGVKTESGVFSIDSLKESINNNQPVIICIQAWGKQNDYENVYKEGHYVTVIGYNNDGFIIEDPSISARYGFISYDDLDSRWHDVDKNDKKYDHFGITIKCNKKYSPEKMEVIEGNEMKNIVDDYLCQIQEAGFEDKPKGWTDKSVEKYSRTFSKKMKGGVKATGFFDKCVKKMKDKMDNPEGFCAALKDEAYKSTYWRGKDKSPSEVSKDVKKNQNVKEGIELVDDFINQLYTDNRSQAKEWRGTNIPYGDDSNRPNLIRKCMTLEGNRQKINCLRKLRDQVAMNPFYQARLDRFVDAITDTYEPTKHQGTIPGNEFKPTAVGEDLK